MWRGVTALFLCRCIHTRGLTHFLYYWAHDLPCSWKDERWRNTSPLTPPKKNAVCESGWNIAIMLLGHKKIHGRNHVNKVGQNCHQNKTPETICCVRFKITHDIMSAVTEMPFMNVTRKWPACSFRGFCFLIFRRFPKQSLVQLLFSNPGVFSSVFQIYVSGPQKRALVSSRTSLSGGTTVQVFHSDAHRSFSQSPACFKSRSRASSVGSQTRWRASSPPGCRSTSRMETFLKTEEQYWAQSRTASGLSRPLMAARKDLLHSTDGTPQNQVRAMQVRHSHQSALWRLGNLRGGGGGFYMRVLCANNLLWSLAQSPQPAGRPWTFTSACFPGLLWVAPTWRSPPWMSPPPTWGWRAASCLSPPPPPPPDLSPQDSPWSKKSRTTFRSMKTITSPPRAVFRPAPPTKVRRRVYCSLWLSVKGVISKDGCSSHFNSHHSGFISQCQLRGHTVQAVWLCQLHWLWSFKSRKQTLLWQILNLIWLDFLFRSCKF